MTREEEEEKLQQNEERVLTEQELSNSLLQKNYKRAIKLAFVLEQPFKILSIFEQILEEGETASTIQDIVANFSPDQIEFCMQYIREWNTNAKHSLVAQIVLKSLLSYYPPNVFETNPKAKELLEGIIPYTERHFQRIDNLLQKSFLVDYVLQRMKFVAENEEQETQEIDTEEERLQKRLKISAE